MGLEKVGEVRTFYARGRPLLIAKQCPGRPGPGGRSVTWNLPSFSLGSRKSPRRRSGRWRSRRAGRGRTPYPTHLERHTSNRSLIVTVPAIKSATVWTIFFSLRGSLPRNQWSLAMVIAVSVFSFVASLLLGGMDEGYGRSEWSPSWAFVGWSFAVLCIVTLLCAKRLLDCHRPVWLALPILGPGLLLGLVFALGIEPSWSILALMAGYLAALTLPGLIACAAYGADD